ncbi:hypothetical protein BATDEDRAFT_25717 [Batrachochytrium dendrobatidis JAM81]|uniref:F-box domain-containing protein n=2 Tax=Batrachochytrium dendrobatidis TaxID=109871 RepID=F4P5E0_BATDJ|nr:uncharacterized protein BATDEDRAFT_25717 [Batrachochytrium dendrobatidis JAM81]EGF79178.1 hypothetical protein BATDEDRAFT_25717 [Batrachochytrium dendrobatidis JAM81]|eukprot:XP_006679859.1 hypothetical protein BATDEDRAFT_25717 [Batrachochytrium dendrobatidis JAM81]
MIRIIPDILPEIFKFLTDKSGVLFSCCLVNRIWYQAALRPLYTSPRLQSVWALRKFTQMLVAKPYLARFVWYLVLSEIRTTISPHILSQLIPLLTHVHHIDLSYCREIQDIHVQTLTRQCGSELTSIILAGNRHLTDATIEAIANYIGKSLVSLCIDECHRITNGALSYIASQCTQLTTLKLASTQSNRGDISIASFVWPTTASCCSTLTTLRLYDCTDITDTSLILLAQACSNITAVEMFRLPHVSDIALIAISKHTQLHTLCVGEMRYITDLSICEVGRQCDIRSLTICHCDSITDRGMVELIRHSPNMQFLDIALLGDITLISLVATSQCCPLLQDLVVSGNLYSEGIPTRAVMDIAKTFVGLGSLTIFQSRDIDMDDIEAFALACPNVGCIFVRQCVNISPLLAETFCKTHKTRLIVQ